MNDEYKQERIALKNRLHASLFKESHEDDKTGTLDEQARTLNLLFRHLISDGTGFYADTQQVMGALKAQNQYRYTLREIRVEESRKKKT